MNYCSQCTISIPQGQTICSMCYGDINHGSDGYYRQMMEEEYRRKREEEQWEEEQRYRE